MKNCKIHPGKLKPAPKKVLWLRFYKVLIFTPLFLTTSANFAKQKTFFFERWPPNLTMFPNAQYIKKCFGQKSCKKKWFPPKLQVFYWFGVVGISLTKWQKMAILRLSWRGPTNSKNYILQLICVKKGLFLPHTSVGNAVFAFLVHFPEVQTLVEIS